MSGLEKLGETSGGAEAPPDDAIVEYDNAAVPSRRMEIVIAAVALALSLLALVLSRNIYLRMGEGGLDPKWWPTVLSIGSSVLSAILLAVAMMGPVAERYDLESSQNDGWPRMLAALALSALYLVAWWQWGYIVPTLVYLFALLWLFKVRGWLPLILFPALTTAFIYGLFHLLLRVPL